MADQGEDNEWIRLSLAGDHNAFARLVEKHQRLIHALTFRMTGSLADADDLTQETFIQAFRQMAAFRGEASFSSWLYRIATNLTLNHKKSHQRRHALHERWSDEEKDKADDDGASEAVQQALMRLPDKQRAAIVLTTYEGLNHAQAAAVLGCSETTVSWRIFMARRRLKQLLKNLAEKGVVHAG